MTFLPEKSYFTCIVGPPVVRDREIFAPKFTYALAIHSLDVIPLTSENETGSREVGSGGSLLMQNSGFDAVSNQLNA
jgi:hypothetical protein